MIIYIIYNITLFLIAPIFIWQLYKPKDGKPLYGSRWKEHFGLTPQIKGIEPIWIHAVSVGESIAAIPLIKKLKALDPHQSIIVTTTTSTGAKEISKLVDLVEHRYMPLDFTFAINRFIKVVRPKKLLIIETELWPNTLNQLKKHNIEVIIVNARLSEKSKQSYARIKPLFLAMQSNINRILCQSENDRARFLDLGCPADKLYVTGTIKLDISISETDITKGRKLRRQIGEKRFVWAAASTHEGEDNVCLEAHKHLLRRVPDAVLILIPRHPERFEQVARLVQEHGLILQQRTIAEPNCNTSVYLADTMGEMLAILSATDCCFMGGSLLGDKVGGHNVLEPAALGLPIICGPSFYNFKELTDSLIDLQVVHIADNANDIAQLLFEDYEMPQKRSKRGECGKKFVIENQGSLDKTIQWIH